MPVTSSDAHVPPAGVSLGSVLREWGRIGCIGFGGPPAHLRLLRQLCVERRRWMDASEFEDAVATCHLLPGPSSLQLAVFCAWRVRGRLGAAIGGVAFVVPGLTMIMVLAVLFLGTACPSWARGTGAGAGAAVPAVALQAGWSLIPASRARHRHRLRWSAYLICGGTAAALVGPWLVLALLGCGIVELALNSTQRPGRSYRVARAVSPGPASLGPAATMTHVAAGGLAGGVLMSLSWVAFKVGALSYGGGFVIIPLMQDDAVDRYHWMTGPQFLNAVALGQITPGPLAQTVAVVGYSAAGALGALVASVVAFGPSFTLVLLGADRFAQLRSGPRVRAFLDGTGPSAIGAILGSALTLGRTLTAPWQFGVLTGAALALLLWRRGVIITLVVAGLAGLALTMAGAPLPR